MQGSWSLEERHDMDAFLKSFGFNPVQRLAVVKAGQVQIIHRKGHNLHIVTRDIRGTSELVLPLGGPAVIGEGDGDMRVSRRAYEDGADLVITESEEPRSREPLSVCRRSIREDGRMCVDVRKRTPAGDVATMRIVFKALADETASGDGLERREAKEGGMQSQGRA